MHGVQAQQSTGTLTRIHKVTDIDTCTLELQRMFEHSNIIRLRFSRTNFFYERTFVVARWSIFGSHFAERSFGLARESHGCMALLLKSCADACHVPESSSEISKEAVT